MKYLKLALFSFICAIIFVLTAEILHVSPIYYLVLLSILSCITFLLIWLCTVLFHRFKHSLNVILIIIFLVISCVAFLFQPEVVHIETIADLTHINYISLIGIISALACCLSVLVLIAQLIFGRKSTDFPIIEDSSVITENFSERTSANNHQ